MDLATCDHLLTTTRSVRRRLDLERPVEASVLLECIRIATQAPTGSNAQRWRFVVVTDPEIKRAIGEVYRARGTEYLEKASTDPHRNDSGGRLSTSVQHLIEVIDRVPAMVIPCQLGRPPAGTGAAPYYGSILPAVWSFMLALRARGLGSAWTTFHLSRERDVAEILGIPYDEVTQVALLPVAYTIGTDFKPAPRTPAEEVTYLDRWGAPLDLG